MVLPMLASVGSIAGTAGTAASIGSTLGSIGSFASGLGSLASGFGLGGDDGPGFTEQKNQAQDFTASQIRAKMLGSARFATEAGKKYGLHPTVLLGQGGGQSATFQSGGGNSWNPAEIGQGVDRALNAGRTGVQRKLDELALEKAGLENDYIRTQIAASQKAIATSGATVALPNDVRDSHSNDVIKRVGTKDRPVSVNKFGTARQIEPLLRKLEDPLGKGYYTYGYNEDAGESELLQAMTALGVTLPIMLKNRYKKWAKKPWRKREFPSPFSIYKKIAR